MMRTERQPQAKMDSQRNIERLIFHLLLLSLATLLIYGCSSRIEPIQNVYDEPATRELTLAEMATAIESGATRAGWRTKSIADDQTLAMYELRNHRVIVTIDFSPDKFSIVYRNSLNMKVICSGRTFASDYVVTTGEDPCPGHAMPEYIHKSYNEWVNELDASIRSAIWQR